MNTYQILGTSTFIYFNGTKEFIEIEFNELRNFLNNTYGLGTDLIVFAEPNKINAKKIIELRQSDYDQTSKELGYMLLKSPSIE